MTNKSRKVFYLKQWDIDAFKISDQYAKIIEGYYNDATSEVSVRLAAGKFDISKKAFEFANCPRATRRAVDKIVAELSTKVETKINSSTKVQWLFSCKKNDAFIESIMDTSKLSKSTLKTYKGRNLDALATFQKRKVNGMGLSDRIWKINNNYKAQLEQSIDASLGSGQSAANLAKELKKNLQDPDRLYRRVRSKRGNLHLSKNAAAFHPGQGVYRSAHKNAMRLATTETNMSYRNSDVLRYQKLDFIVGYEVSRSNHVYVCELCEMLKGNYPKWFQFEGWHPHCRCFVTPILMSREEMRKQRKENLNAAFQGRDASKYKSASAVTDVPAGMKKFISTYSGKQKNWKSTPFFIKHNFVDSQLSKGFKNAVTNSVTKTAAIATKSIIQAPVSVVKETIITDAMPTIARKTTAYLGDSKTASAAEKISNIATLFEDYESANGGNKIMIAQIRRDVAKGNSTDFSSFINQFDKGIGDFKNGAKYRLLASSRLDELKSIKSISHIPEAWRKPFVNAINKINTTNGGLDNVYNIIEHAYSINTLSLNKEAIAYGLDRLSVNTPAQIFTKMVKAQKSMLNNLPKKEFFDALGEYIPLNTTGNRGACFSPALKEVTIPVGKRFKSCGLYQQKIFYHEYGHAMDTLNGWKNSAKFKEFIDDIKKDFRKKTYGTAQKEVMQEIVNQYKSTKAIDKEWTATFDELMGAYCDTAQPMFSGYKYLGNMGHSTRYFQDSGKRYAEVIAHMSENYWGGNEVFKKMNEEVYKKMNEFFSQVIKELK